MNNSISLDQFGALSGTDPLSTLDPFQNEDKVQNGTHCNQNFYHELEESIHQLLDQQGYNIPACEVWKLLFMERKFLMQGKLYYEQEEPGYLEGNEKGYFLMLETLSSPLSPELYVQLHDACVENLEVNGEKIPTGFRTHQDGGEAFYLISGETMSLDGCQELIERYNTYS